MSQPLSAADRSAITAEQGPVNMTMGAVVLLEDGPGLDYDAVCRRIMERIHLVPRYRQRLQEPTVAVRAQKPNDFLFHSWVADENFEVGMHVRLGALPAPAGERELADYVAREFSRRLDRSRSPWEIHLIRGLDGGRAAMILKMHHALVDGLAALGIGMVLFDAEPHPPVVEAVPASEARSGMALHRYLARLATNSATRPARLLWGAADRYLSAPTAVEGDLRRARDVVAAMVRNRAAAPMLPFNRTITANRSYALGATPFAPLRSVGKAAGGTVNDAVLAAVCGMLDRYLAAAGVDPTGLAGDPVALVPVSVRRPDEEGGNRISIVFVDLPVRERDPMRRIQLINERTRRLRGSAEVIAGALIVSSIGFVPPLVTSAISSAPSLPKVPALPKVPTKVANLSKVAGLPRREPAPARVPNNLVVSNIPGPQVPLYFNGTLVLGAHPVVPLNPANQGINVGVFSYNHGFYWGITADRALQPSIDVAADALRAAIDELVALAPRG
ncbi:MAG: wax ester/triacylglycerol synthase family O-acyltransferase [Jatrophihabitans sp.]|uniref:wax ester/triacylglycerol synthase family O-acyltransferase n=1 Tax=Jatrophihabitans sp. TaxID=1932789 RepID=UPI003F7DFA3C